MMIMEVVEEMKMEILRSLRKFPLNSFTLEGESFCRKIPNGNTRKSRSNNISQRENDVRTFFECPRTNIWVFFVIVASTLVAYTFYSTIYC